MSSRRALLLLAGLALPLAGPLGAQQPARGTEPWRIVPMPQATLVLARDGSLIGEIGRARRVNVSLRSLPRHLPQAFVAIEDQRFYQHDGVDVVGIAGALKDAVLRGAVRGASTITQQLVGNMHPEVIDRSDRSPARKLREQQAAREMEKRYTKEQILEAYLNLIEFGHGWNGIEMAARHYFGKGAADVTLAEAATLAALPANPPYFDPIANPQRARARRNLVLDQMAAQGYVTAAQARAAKAEPVRTVPNAGFSARARWVVDVVRVQAERAGVSVTEGGYRIVTTIDPALQRAADSALAVGLAEVEARPGYRHLKYASRPKGRTDYLQGAVVVLDPATGGVRALVGGRDYAESQYNRAVSAMRQPGSAFKPFVYATAVAESLPPNALVGDTAIALVMDGGRVYAPRNSDGEYMGNIPLRDALAASRNPVAVELGQRYGMARVTATARAMGIDASISPWPSSALGASVVQPLDLVAAYASFATLGVRLEPRFIERVETAEGRTAWMPDVPRPALAMDPKVAFIVRDMMRDVVERGTAQSVRRWVPSSIPVAGKTGTTDDNADVWFVGMTPDLVAGVWIGFDQPKSIAPGAAGGSLAAPVFARVVADHYRRHPVPREWTPPEGLVAAELVRGTGEPATPFTPVEQRYVEWFLPGTEPGAVRVSPWRLFQWGPITPF